MEYIIYNIYNIYIYIIYRSRRPLLKMWRQFFSHYFVFSLQVAAKQSQMVASQVCFLVMACAISFDSYIYRRIRRKVTMYPMLLMCFG